MCTKLILIILTTQFQYHHGDFMEMGLYFSFLRRINAEDSLCGIAILANSISPIYEMIDMKIGHLRQL